MKFFRDKVQVIPSGIGEEAGVDGQGYVYGLRVGPCHWVMEVLRVTNAEPPQACDHDYDQGKYLCTRENVLYPGGPFHVPAVDRRQEAWKT